MSICLGSTNHRAAAQQRKNSQGADAGFQFVTAGSGLGAEDTQGGSNGERITLSVRLKKSHCCADAARRDVNIAIPFAVCPSVCHTPVLY